LARLPRCSSLTFSVLPQEQWMLMGMAELLHEKRAGVGIKGMGLFYMTNFDLSSTELRNSK
jgi:hypothetical protein